MRVRHYLGFPILAIGLSIFMLGLHWFGPLWFWGGIFIVAIGFAIVSSDDLEGKIENSLKSYRGPRDFGNNDYHGSNSHDFDGGDGGGHNSD